jgi:hypothetical protein
MYGKKMFKFRLVLSIKMKLNMYFACTEWRRIENDRLLFIKITVMMTINFFPYGKGLLSLVWILFSAWFDSILSEITGQASYRIPGNCSGVTISLQCTYIISAH